MDDMQGVGFEEYITGIGAHHQSVKIEGFSFHNAYEVGIIAFLKSFIKVCKIFICLLEPLLCIRMPGHELVSLAAAHRLNAFINDENGIA